MAPPQAAPCIHPTLRFHAGGFYIECAHCFKWWMAIERKTTTDKDPDYTRASEGLTVHDSRIQRKRWPFG